jgi:Uma2 family endonuclease
MAKLVLPRENLRDMIRDRAERGADRYDEVWNGVYVMSPLADFEHQQIVAGLVTILQITVQWEGNGAVVAGTNISDRERGWRRNYRIPDVALFLTGTAAQNKGMYWLGGPDFAIEITSRGDRTRKKIQFYAKVGTRELLVVDRRSWTLELYRRDGKALPIVATAQPGDGQALRSEVVPLSFALRAGTPRPAIEVIHADGILHWSA